VGKGKDRLKSAVPELRGMNPHAPQRPFAEELRAALAASSFRTKGDRTRQRLRIAAAEVMETEGFPGLRVSDVCARADVAQGTFYVYFRDKIEIAVDVLTGFADTLLDGVAEISGGKDDYEAIHGSILYFINAYRANRGLMRCHVQMLSQEPAFVAVWLPRHRAWQDRIAHSIERRTRGQIAGERALSVSTALEGMVFKYLYSALVTRGELREDDGAGAEEMAHMLSVLWYRAVYAKDPDHVGGQGRDVPDGVV
jgi:AcrR family transcriptional regulator